MMDDLAFGHGRMRPATCVKISNIARLRAAGGGQHLVNGEVSLMEPCSPVFVFHEWKEPKPRLREPLDDRRFGVARDRGIDAAIDDEVPMRLESGSVEND